MAFKHLVILWHNRLRVKTNPNKLVSKLLTIETEPKTNLIDYEKEFGMTFIIINIQSTLVIPKPRYTKDHDIPKILQIQFWLYLKSFDIPSLL